MARPTDWLQGEFYDSLLGHFGLNTPGQVRAVVDMVGEVLRRNAVIAPGLTAAPIPLS